jgi:acetoin utilization deacetylase AcuC-like enzyme
LTSGDFADLTTRVLALGPPRRCVVFLEGGYDLRALADSSAACVAGLVGERLAPEPPSSGGAGRPVIDAALRLRAEAADQ